MDILMNGHRAEQVEDWTQGLSMPHVPVETLPQSVTLRNVEMEKGQVKVILVHDIHVTDENKMVALKASLLLASIATSASILVVLLLGLS